MVDLVAPVSENLGDVELRDRRADLETRRRRRRRRRERGTSMSPFKDFILRSDVQEASRSFIQRIQIVSDFFKKGYIFLSVDLQTV